MDRKRCVVGLCNIVPVHSGFREVLGALGGVRSKGSGLLFLQI